MTIQYVMSREQWVKEALELLPDCYTSDREGLVDDLAREYGILWGLVSGGWYPNEAIGNLLDKDYDKGKIDDTDIDQFEERLRLMGERAQETYRKNNSED